jgi:hypothetical protein
MTDQPGGQLGPCPRCGKPEGKMRDVERGRFRFYVYCAACTFMTEPARTEGIATNLWNDAKPAKEKPARRGRRAIPRPGKSK